MNNKYRSRSAATRSRVASPLGLQRVLIGESGLIYSLLDEHCSSGGSVAKN